MTLCTFDYRTYRESFASQSSAGRYNPATALRWKHRGISQRTVIGAGSSDECEVFHTGGKAKDRHVVVVSRNCGLGYVGVEVFPYLTEYSARKQSDPTIPWSEPSEWDLFFQNASEDLGTEKWEDWTMRHLAKVLLDWWQ